MRKYLILPIILLPPLSTSAQVADTGSFILHKFQQAIGRETYTAHKTGTATTYSVDFSFTDRSTKVPLQATMTIVPPLEPRALRIKGKTSRITRIDDSVTLQGPLAHIKVNDSTYSIEPDPLAFPMTGYAPVTFQMFLVQYWKNHGQPASIPLLPSGAAMIRKDGNDTLTWEGRPLILERYIIGGLIWGNEFLWTGSDGRLFCLITIDAEADKFEATLPAYDGILPMLLKKAAVYGVRLYPLSRISSGEPYPYLAFTGGVLVDVVGGRSIPRSTVLVDHGRIAGAGSADSISIPRNYHVIHTEGKTVLPGLWDMHAHFEQVEWGPAYLAAGVTTVRDCGNEFEFINAVQKAIDAGEGMGPHILKAGIIDGKGPYALGIIQAGNAAEAVAAVDRYKANGFVQIKIYSSVKPAVVKAICDEAHRVGLSVTGHIPNGMNLFQGVDSGMDMVNHIEYVADVLKASGANFSIDFADPQNVKALRFMKDHHTVVDPTLAVFELMFRSLSDSITSIEPNFYTLPPSLQALFINAGMEAKIAARYKPLFDSWVNIVKALHENGIPIVAGTDQAFPGYSLDRELELYVRAGLTPMEALQAATITPARVMKMDNTTGSISVGKDADLIVVDGNPVEDIRQLRKVYWVFKNGIGYGPLSLHRLVGFNL
jgi:imidazolonepropionase-like amidohydrolase